ncbi:hypothetical protein BDN70DRAFT_116577 [Pholiota conissans]|uniref:Uncharacterized protein n=1 Tax=Pholiota conissans TaxID=109636 RepID=A0A9P5YWX3_9AGAR|nr:hypothetical protein BDN70DRAFT_116577 [Pholiota conissans]
MQPVRKMTLGGGYEREVESGGEETGLLQTDIVNVPPSTPLRVAFSNTPGSSNDLLAAVLRPSQPITASSSSPPLMSAASPDDPYDYPDNPIATGHRYHHHQQQQHDPVPVSPPPTPPKPAHHSPASPHRTSPPPRNGSFKAFASSPLAGSLPSASSAPFLVLTSGGPDGASASGQRGSTLFDGPRTSRQYQQQQQPQGGQPTPRSSHSSSASSSMPANGSGSLSASTSSTAATPPLANTTSTSTSSTFVSPFSRPGTRPLLAPSSASGSMANMAGLAFAGLPPPQPPTTAVPNAMQSSTSGSMTGASSRGSMILYRLSAGEEGVFSPGALAGPTPPGLAHTYGASVRHSAFYSETDSLTLDGDSKYPAFMPGGGSSGMGTPRGSVLGLAPPGSPGAVGAPAAPPGTTPFTLGMRSSLAELSSLGRAQGGLVAYVYDPDDDDDDDDDYDYEDDYYPADDKGRKEREEKRREEWVHDPSEVNALYADSLKGKRSTSGSPPTPNTPAGAVVGGGKNASGHPPGQRRPYRPQQSSGISTRGFVNITTLVALTVGLLCLFIVLPVAKAFTDNGVATKILGNTRINATGQAERRDLGSREWRIDWEQER